MEPMIESSEQEINLRDYIIVFYKHKWIIIASLLIAVSLMILYSKRQQPIYQTQSSIIISEPNRAKNAVLPQSAGADESDYLYLETQMEIIKTTPVLSLAVKQLNMMPASEGTQEFSNAVKSLKGCLRVSASKDTRIVNIIAKNSDPKMAADIANTVAQAYVDQDKLSRIQSGRDSIKWMSAQLADLKIKLKNSEDALQRFKEKEGMTTMDERRGEYLDQISRLNSDCLSARANRLEIEAIINNLKSEEGVEQNIPVGLLDGPTLQKLGIELSQLQTELAEKSQRFKDTYPGVIELKNRVRLTGQKILTELERQRDFLKSQENSLLAQQKTNLQETLNLSKKEMEYLTLEREITTDREMYNALLSRFKELTLFKEIDLNNIRIVEPAELPGVPLGKGNLLLVLGVVMGLFFGIGLALIIEYMRNTIDTPDDVAEHLGLPVFGIVPRISKATRAKTPPIIMNNGKKEVAVEAYRSLRTNILSFILGNSLRTITVTSAGPQEGKSLTAVNLSIALANAGQNVLLVDADLRRPKLHRIFNVNRYKGLSTVLNYEVDIKDAVIGIMPNLNILVSGALPKESSEVLGSDRMKELINSIRQDYNIVIFDSAPILGMTDGVVLATETDVTIMIVKTEGVTRKALKIAVNQLEQVGVKICGVVLNNVNVRRDRYYDYYHRYYYSPYEDEERKASVKRIRKRKYYKESQDNIKEFRAG